MILNGFNENDLEIFRSEFSDFLPEKVFDFHIHLNKKDFILKDMEREGNLNPFFKEEIMVDLPYEKYKSIAEEIFPGKVYEGFFFGLPFKGIDIDRSNEYISEVCRENSCNGLYVVTPEIEEIPQDLFQKKFLGFKPYPELAKSVNLSGYDISKLDMDVSIYDILPDKTLEYANKHRMIIILHLPRKDRLNDKRNIDEIKDICKSYPHIQLVLAHIGRSYCYADLEHGIEQIKGLENLYVDTANISNPDVIKKSIEELGTDRVIYGSDIPLGLFKGKDVDINNKHYFVTDKPTTWSLSSSHIRLDNFTLLIYEVIRSIKVASEGLKLSEKDIQYIFHDNASRLMDRVIAE